MPIKQVVSRGIGFSPGVVAYIIRGGLGSSAVAVAAVRGNIRLTDAKTSDARLGDAVVHSVRLSHAQTSVVRVTDG